MNHLLVLPIIVPAFMAGILVLAFRHHLDLQRLFSVAGTVALLAIAVLMTARAGTDEILVYALGDWIAPFGIVLVLDRLSAIMVLVTCVLALAVVLYAAGSGWDRRGPHFHPLFHFQLMGILGAFLTGDLFNLFVFFEVLLIASYGLMVHAGGARRMRAGVQYVVYNLLGSTLFLFALGILYSVTGTLNMADMAARVAQIGAEHAGLLRVGALLLMVVFSVKAALLPLHFWLPETYTQAPGPVAALFAIMTKVGAYAILRVDTLIFGPDVAATSGLMTPLILAAAIATLALGMIGMLGAVSLGSLAAFATVGSVGTLMVSLAIFTPETTSAALYYILHSTLAGGLLFLVVDMVRERRGAAGDALVTAPRIGQSGLVTALYFGAAIAVAGMPPLSGFLGKLLVLDAVRVHDWWPVIWVVVLAGSLVAIMGLAQAGSAVFWKVDGDAVKDAAPPPPTALPAAAVMGLGAAIVALTVAAGPVTRYLEATSAQLYAPSGYIDAVYDNPAQALPYPDAKPTPNRLPWPAAPEGEAAEADKGGT